MSNTRRTSMPSIPRQGHATRARTQVARNVFLTTHHAQTHRAPCTRVQPTANPTLRAQARATHVSSCDTVITPSGTPGESTPTTHARSTSL